MTLETHQEWSNQRNMVQIKDHLRYIHGFEKQKFYEVIEWGKFIDENQISTYGAKIKPDGNREPVWLRWYDVF